jgi:ABC-type sugar transport system substrate-binding protein
MRRSFSRYWVGPSCLALLVLLASGCKDPFAPPSRVKPLPKLGDSPGAKPNFLVFVVPGSPTGDLEAWSYRAQHEANDKRAVFRIMGPGPKGSAAEQPETVRKSVIEGASALIVYPGDSPELPRALADAEAKGVPVVLIDKPVAAPEGSKPFTVVEPAPFEDTARKIVAATLEDLSKASRPLNGTAILLVDSKLVDQNSGRRVEALKSAAEAAKFRRVLTVPFDGSRQDAAKLAVLEAVKANPDVSVVLTEDGEGLVGAAQARVDLKGKPIIFVGGYTDYRSSRVLTPPLRESCYVEGRFIELGAQAVLIALARLRGETVGEHTYVTPKFTRTDAAISTETEPNSSFPELKSTLDLATERKEAQKDVFTLPKKDDPFPSPKKDEGAAKPQ